MPDLSFIEANPSAYVGGKQASWEALLSLHHVTSFVDSERQGQVRVLLCWLQLAQRASVLAVLMMTAALCVTIRGTGFWQILALHSGFEGLRFASERL